ncbi:MAG: aminotransferase class I/II-fold pyridoxal phosphate-dependent enzyme [Desulfobacterales bacterium]|nr:aminotransferase class I/II-fold pyridoxal phosphate-dependent enzyme [Desulfobacterales bacterium]MDD4073290.1 aminotransferase class I/II-fold pyridoxal phosphate-dependent enzyme [Desulfobacterales bacterium]MDD4393858.1 aminotransferase class I/II-fold pyridoxal phosphate-dependent enzyme [Desulfobacterales bacterium]
MSDKPHIKFADRMDQLPPYLFGRINKLKMKKRWNGDDVIDLGMGSPIDPAPDMVIQKLCEGAQDPKIHRYPASNGLRNLRQEITKSYRKDYDVNLDSESEIICTIGSKEGISHLCMALIGPGDTVLIPTPAFPIHIYAPIIAGGNAIRIPLATEEVFLNQLVTMCESIYPRPKVLIISYPHNPTSAIASMELFKEIVALAKRYQLIVIHDFAYAKITYDGYVAPSFLEAPGAIDVGVEFGTFSKTYNMAGWRMGYCVGNPDIIAALAKIKGYYDYGIFNAIQIAGIVALRHCDDEIRHQVQLYQSRRDTLCRGLTAMGWDITPPKAGMFVWAKIPEPFSRMGSMKFSIEMMNRANVAMAPGIGFGDDGEGYLRLALVENEHRIRQALRQMRQAMVEIDPKAVPTPLALAVETADD